MEEWVEPIINVAAETLREVSGAEGTSPTVNFIKGVAATLAGLLSSFSIYRAWRTMDSKMGARLDDFLDSEQKKLDNVRDNIRTYRIRHGMPILGDVNIRTNQEILAIFKSFNTNRMQNIERKLEKALTSSSERVDKALKAAEKHRKQKAIAHILLGARYVRRGEHSKALNQFRHAISINENDAEALDYAGHAAIKLGLHEQALEYFQQIAELAETKIRVSETGEERAMSELMLSRAHRGQGLAYQSRRDPNLRLAYSSYTAAADCFPENKEPLIDYADIHQLRGRMAIEQSFWNQAGTSLSLALEGFDEIEQNDPDYVHMAQKGKALTLEAMQNLDAARNAPGPISI